MMKSRFSFLRWVRSTVSGSRRKPNREAGGSRSRDGRPKESVSEQWMLKAVTAVILVSLFGFGTFGLHPELTVEYPWSAPIFAVSYSLFAQLQIWLMAACLAWVLLKRASIAWTGGFLLVFALSFISEHVGTGYGIPFGPYSYTDLLGPKLGGRVPWTIPVSWYVACLPAFSMAYERWPRQSWSWERILMTSVLVTVWDLALDPAMSRLAPYWQWAEEGPYYGMPLLNLVGWLVTGVVLSFALEVARTQRWIGQTPKRWMALFYFLNVLLPWGMCVLAGYWGAAALSLLAVGLAAWKLKKPSRFDRADGAAQSANL